VSGIPGVRARCKRHAIVSPALRRLA